MKRYICMEPNELGFETRFQAQSWADAPHNRGKQFRVVEVTEVDLATAQRIEAERKAELDKAYADGMAMARRMVRLQLGISVPGDSF